MWKMLFPAVEKAPEELSSRRAAGNIPAPQVAPVTGQFTRGQFTQKFDFFFEKY